MQNEGTQVTTLINRTVTPSVLLTTVLQSPVYWDDLSMTWDELTIPWNNLTDVTPLTNQTI